MSVLKRLVPYILLNVIVSALVTFAVLTWWTNNRSAPANPVGVLPTQAAAANPVPATALPMDAKVIEIGGVSAAGALNAEQVTLKRIGQGELRLQGWRIDDNAGHRFVFPDIILYPDGEVHLFTRTGTNNVNDLFWGLAQPVWGSGKTVTLYDQQNILRASLTLP